MPKDKNYASLLCNRKSFHDDHTFVREEVFLPDTIREFTRLLSLLILSEARAEGLRKGLKSRPKFDMS